MNEQPKPFSGQIKPFSGVIVVDTEAWPIDFYRQLVHVFRPVEWIQAGPRNVPMLDGIRWTRRGEPVEQIPKHLFNVIVCETCLPDGKVVKVAGRSFKDVVENVASALNFKMVPPKQIPSVPPPTVADMMSNFGHAMARWAKSGFKLVDEQTYRQRITICRGCPLWDEQARMGAGKCKHHKCGCTKTKHWLATEKCPLGKWNAVEK